MVNLPRIATVSIALPAIMYQFLMRKSLFDILATVALSPFEAASILGISKRERPEETHQQG